MHVDDVTKLMCRLVKSFLDIQSDFDQIFMDYAKLQLFSVILGDFTELLIIQYLLLRMCSSVTYNHVQTF